MPVPSMDITTIKSTIVVGAISASAEAKNKNPHNLDGNPQVIKRKPHVIDVVSVPSMPAN
jgi:hypothetical protein